MSDGAARSAREIDLCNALPRPLLLWFEPWAQEFELPARARLSLRCSAPAGSDPTPRLEAVDDDMLTIWGASGSRIAVFIDDVDQDSFTGNCEAPDLGPLSSKEFVNLVFRAAPEARPGGRRAPRRGWLSRVFGPR